MRPTATEAHVLVRAAEDVELERAVELILVAVRGDVPDADLVAILELLAAQYRVACDVAPEVHDRRRPPHDLVGRRLRARRVVDQQLVLLGEVAERLDAVRDRIACRLVARHRDEQEEQIEVHLAESVTVDLGVEQRADDVVARLLAPFHRELVRVHEHLDLRVHDRERMGSPRAGRSLQPPLQRVLVAADVGPDPLAALRKEEGHAPQARIDGVIHGVARSGEVLEEHAGEEEVVGILRDSEAARAPDHRATAVGADDEARLDLFAPSIGLDLHPGRLSGSNLDHARATAHLRPRCRGRL